MKRMKCIVSYDGTGFAGYQVQPGKRTVQSVIEEAMKKLHKGSRVKITASGRTDAGVHAKGQVFHFDTPLEIPVEKWNIAYSYERMHFLLGRYEKTASEFYQEYVENNHFFANESIKKMSRLTDNLLHALDYDNIRRIRTKNFEYLNKKLQDINRCKLIVPEGAYAYPLYIENGAVIRKMLQEKKIYIPTLWPAVFELCREDELEYQMAENILPLPVDQRYDSQDMEYLVEVIRRVSTQRT